MKHEIYLTYSELLGIEKETGVCQVDTFDDGKAGEYLPEHKRIAYEVAVSMGIIGMQLLPVGHDDALNSDEVWEFDTAENLAKFMMSR